MEWWFWTYDWICLLGPSGPNVVSRPQTDPKVNFFFEVSGFYWIHLMILDKMKSQFRKLQPGFWTNGWIRLLGPSFPNVVSRPWAPRSVNFLRFQNFIRFILWFLKKEGFVWENWSQGSALMAGYIVWAQVAKM